MSYKEAVEDGVKFICNKNGLDWYFPKCCKCGCEVPNWGYKHGVKYICKKCKEESALSDKTQSISDDYFSKEKKFEKAVNRIHEACGYGKKAEKYKEAEEVVHGKLHTHGWFDSTEEIMVAIELLKNRIRIRHQVKFGSRYRADFVIDSMNVVLECDGVCYHTERTKAKEEIRDSLIIASLGPKWEVIRITDTLIDQNITRLVPAIRAVKKQRQAVREKNGGYLPEWYTDRKMA